MAYIYKTVMKAENHDFDICQNRVNSRQTLIVAIPKDKGYTDTKTIGVIQNKTGKIVIMDSHHFSDKTIARLKNILSF